MTTKAAIGFLTVEQSVVTSLGNGPWDIALCFTSWESRADAAFPLVAQANCPTHIVRFASESADINGKKDRIIRGAENIFGDRLVKHALAPSIDFSVNAISIESILRELARTKGRPARVLVDITCIPKRYILFLLACGFKREYVATFDFLYSEGAYSTPPVPSSLALPTTRGLISEGDWTSLQIPYLEGREYAPATRDLFVSLGAEVVAALPLIDRFEPRLLKILCVSGDDNLVPQGERDRERRPRETLVGRPNAAAASFGLFDVIEVAEWILAEKIGISTCLALGPKPHAVALALASLADDSIDVVCRVPSAYTAAEVVPTGRILRIKIDDRFEPHSYL